MAGIGFSLKKLFKKKGILNLCKAYGYSGIVTIGPMILGVCLLVGMAFVARMGGMSDHDRELLNCMLTYSLLIALFITNWFNMIVTRYVSDMIYEDREKRVMPSFHGAVAIEALICLVCYGIFLILSRVTVIRGFLCLWLAMILIVVWTEMIYMTALKDFQAIVLSFALSLMAGFLVALILVVAGHISLEMCLLCVILGYTILAVRQYKLMLDYFPASEGSIYSFLLWFDKYPALALSGGLMGIGLFSHIVIMYFGPLQVQVEGLFYGAPEYDVPALIAFSSLLITTVSFVVSVEVNFYPKYSNYYGLFGDRGAIGDIKLAGKEMLDMLRRELIYLASKQIFTTILFVVIGPTVINYLIPGMSSLSMAIFRFLCVGYGSYAIANSLMLIALYFEDYTGALMGSLAFALLSTAANVWQILNGDVKYFGVGFFTGTIAFFFIALIRLHWYTGRLPYFLLSRQSLVPDTQKGLFVSLRRFVLRHALLKRLLALLLIAAISLPGLGGCGVTDTGSFDAYNAGGQAGEDKVRTPDKPAVIKADKAQKSEVNISEKDELYDTWEDDKVTTMYLTVSPGNKADGSKHTWKEINTYSDDDYKKMGVDRYKAEGILKIDETGEGLKEGDYGYDESAPNVSVQIRGQTSTGADQKNYKIRIKDGKERFHGMRTLNLNKHRTEPYRFLNKLCYDLLESIPQLMGGRTRFVHLYVKDETTSGDEEEGEEGEEGEAVSEVVDGYVDYGLFTMVEQVNRNYLKTHGLDENGHLYKVSFFEWNKYDEVMRPLDDPGFSREAFEDYLEIKGNEDPSKLQNVVNELHNYTIPIETIVEEHFDAENISYFLAFNILIGNYDVGPRNMYLYSPLNSQKFYMICWDMDDSFKNTYNRWENYSEGLSWERGMTQFLVVTLINRMMKEEKYRDMLADAVEDLYRNYVTRDIVDEKVRGYRGMIKQYLYRAPDVNHLQLEDMEVYDELTDKLGSEVDENYKNFLNSMKNPWPFYIDLPRVHEGEGKLILSWGISYDINEEDVTYDYILARDYDFTDVVSHGEGLLTPLASLAVPEPGIYFLKVTATNASGYTTDCFDYFSVDDYGKKYGCYGFKLKNDMSVEVYEE
ncbi:MAG: exopolysaccharide Pel transporter PelG [Lachnospiraceae bacterium]|nr:exopolysaccharide Pel transporter PelG [Lachnospiraceae bacterium]